MEVSSTAIPVTESSQAGHARRTAAALAARLGFNEEAQGKVALVQGSHGRHQRDALAGGAPDRDLSTQGGKIGEALRWGWRGAQGSAPDGDGALI